MRLQSQSSQKKKKKKSKVGKTKGERKFKGNEKRKYDCFKVVGANVALNTISHQTTTQNGTRGQLKKFSSSSRTQTGVGEAERPSISTFSRGCPALRMGRLLVAGRLGSAAFRSKGNWLVLHTHRCAKLVKTCKIK